MTISLRLAGVLVATALASVGCLDFSPPPAGEATPTRTPTATVVPPTATITPTPSPTSTSTPEPTATGTPTPFNPFAPTTGATSGGIGLIPPAVGLTEPGPGGSTTGTLTGATLPPVSAAPPPAGAPAPPPAEAPVISWECNGDERIQFVPEAPVVNDDLLITVTSAGDHGYTLLIGPNPVEKVGQGRGGPGFYWQWKRRMDKAGVFRFEFYAGPRIESRCVVGDIRVAAGGPPPTATPIPALAPTPTPTRTPRPDH